MEKRIELVDALRGYALLGLFLVHCVERFELAWLDPQPDLWFESVFAIFGSKAFAIFALLFGFSFATIMGNARARGGDYLGRFVWRLVLLFGFGTLHVVFYRGDILQVLAVVGLLLIPFDRVRSDRLLLALAALFFLQLPLLLRLWAAGEGQGWAAAPPLYFSWGDLRVLADGSLGAVAADNLGAGSVGKWSFYLETGRVVEIAGLFLVGMVAQRRGWFAAAEERRSFWLAVLAASALVWLLATWLAPLAAAPFADHAPQRQVSEWLTGYAAALPATIFQIALFVLAWTTALRTLLALFTAPGRMTLTLYVGQSLVAAPLLYGYGLGLWDDISHGEALAWGLALFAAQVVLARLWFGRFAYGPLEWLWRAGTRTTLAVPFRAKARVRTP